MSISQQTKPHSSRQDTCGFTLLEIIITLALAILIMGTAVPAMGKAMREEAVREPVREIQNLVRFGRNEAIRTQRAKAIRVESNRRGTTLQLIQASDAHMEEAPALESYTLPEKLQLLHKTWQDERWSQPRASQWFLQPTGLMEPIQFRVEKGEDSVEFEFHPLTGNIAEERIMFP